MLHVTQHAISQGVTHELRWGLHALTRVVPAAEGSGAMREIHGNPRLQNAIVWIYGVNQIARSRKWYRAIVIMSLEVLRNAGVALLREDRGVLDPCVSPR
jgi:hypothetical protein